MAMSDVDIVGTATLAKLAVLVWIAYGIGLVVYRLYLHPLAKFPGPKVAAATRWFEFYYDILKGDGAQFALKINEMHETYGPIVRITPEELHIKDSEWYGQLYGDKSVRRHKYSWAASMVGAASSTFGTVDHDLHKIRRQANEGFLSKRSVMAHESSFKISIEKLIRNLDAKAEANEVVSLFPLIMAYTTEIVFQFVFAQSSGLLEDEAASVAWNESMWEVLYAIPLLKQFNWILDAADQIPQAILAMLSPPFARVNAVHKKMLEQASEFLDNPSEEKETTIFHSIYHSNLSSADKTAFRMSKEAFTFLGAAASTTTHAFVYGLYWLSKDPVAYRKLNDSLDQLIPDKYTIPTWNSLQNDPYLTAVIKEALRLRALFTTRLPLQQETSIFYNGLEIPAMTPCSMTIADVLLDPVIFPDPMTFKPERWQDNPDLNQYFIPFGRGGRTCQGLEVAWAELYIGLATVCRRFDFEVVDTDWDRDMKITRDCLVSLPGTGTKGVHMIFKAK